MRSWNLDKFVKEYGVHAATVLWGTSRQAVHQAMLTGRSIQILELDTGYEVRESKLLATAPLSALNLNNGG